MNNVICFDGLDLDLPEFRAISWEDVSDGDRVIKLETIQEVVGCPGCGVVAASKGHANKRTRIRDLPRSGKSVVLEWRKRRWECGEPLCPRKSWTETSEAILPRRVLTERAAYEVARRIGEDGDTPAQLAREFGISWGCAWSAFERYATPRIEDPERLQGVVALGVDETSFLKATRRDSTRYVTGFVDLSGNRPRLLDVIEGRSGNDVADWLKDRSTSWLGQVNTVALDPHRGYANGLQEGLGHAVFVLDHFHAIKLANKRIDQVRCRVQNETLGHRGRKPDPLYRTRKLLLCARERLDPCGYAKLAAYLAAGDPDGEVAATYHAKELLRDVYASRQIGLAKRRLLAFYTHCADHQIRELRSLARTISEWQAELLNYWRTDGVSNGPTEAMNLLIKGIKRAGHGYRNFDHYRLRLLAYAGIDWHTPQTPKLRSRKPRLIA